MSLKQTNLYACETESVVDQLIPNKIAAQILHLSESTLHNDRWQASKSGTSPKIPYVKLPTGGIRYRLSVLQELIEENSVQ